jgi:hypothetical protein
MSDELLLPEEANSATLKQLFDNAYMENSVDSDGDVRIKDRYSCFLRPDPDGRLIALCAIFGANAGAQLGAKLEFVNRVNDQVKLIRASVMSDGRYFFDYYLPVDGGITKKAVVLATRRFLSTIEAAMQQDTANVVA